MEELICFDWCGKMAHFRKFYANASALTHTVPPRTTVLGLLASIIGLPRDSYYSNSIEYKEFDSLLIGVQLMTPVKKINQKLNYLKIDSVNIDDFRGFDNRKQVSSEFIIPQDIRSSGGIVKYRVYVGCKNKNYNLFKKLKQNLSDERYEFGISLGPANLLGYIEREENFSISFTPQNQTNEALNIGSLISENKVSKIIRNEDFALEHDILPVRFTDISDKKNKNRTALTDIFIYSSDASGNLFAELSNFENIFFLPTIKQVICLI
jgi:CRISPR-associated protein Cas5h